MGIVAWVVLGAITGYVVNMIAGRREGPIGTVILGVVGGLVGGFASSEPGAVPGRHARSCSCGTARLPRLTQLFTSSDLLRTAESGPAAGREP